MENKTFWTSIFRGNLEIILLGICISFSVRSCYKLTHMESNLNSFLEESIWNTVFKKKHFKQSFLLIGGQSVTGGTPQWLNCLYKQIKSLKWIDFL
ncbi:hypothetical protein JDS78_24495 [Bacillus cereus group sp. N17]|nr:hypothetical protein IIS_05281 [Bacillus cereus VD131]MBJ8043366.1 hypothetical protein [Bacillus cereus group sp. N17]TBX63418.1 hypothetical protein E0M28_23615 [Bacillus toyonensis]